MTETGTENNEKLDQFRELLQGAFAKQQIEAVVGMLAKLSEALVNMQVGDNVNIKASIRQRKRLKIEIADAPEQKSHFSKIVLGACRKVHIECLRSATELNFKKVEQSLYRILFTNDQEQVEKVKRMKKIAFGIYRGYYRKILASRSANNSSQTFIELQEAFPKIDMQAVFELFSASLEDKQFRMSKGNAEFIKDILWLSRGRIPNKERAQ
jgi:hypothetical protein